MRTVVAAVIGIAVAAPSAAHAYDYVAVDSATLYASKNTAFAALTLDGERILRVVAKRGGWYELETISQAKRNCVGKTQVAAMRVRLFVPVTRVGPLPSRARGLRYRGCKPRKVGFVRAEQRGARLRRAVSVPRRTKQLRARSALFWPDGSRAGTSARPIDLSRWTRQTSTRVCASIRVWRSDPRTQLCFARKRMRNVSVAVGVPGGVETGLVGGVEGGIPGGVPGGVIGGVLRPGSSRVPPPPPPPRRPKYVLQHVLERRRIAGHKRIVPGRAVKLHMAKKRKRQIIASFKLCLNKAGTVSRVKLFKSSGYKTYDRTIRRLMRKWRYRPFMVNAKPVPVCTAVTFIYRQRN